MKTYRKDKWCGGPGTGADGCDETI